MDEPCCIRKFLENSISLTLAGPIRIHALFTPSFVRRGKGRQKEVLLIRGNTYEGLCEVTNAARQGCVQLRETKGQIASAGCSKGTAHPWEDPSDPFGIHLPNQELITHVKAMKRETPVLGHSDY